MQLRRFTLRLIVSVVLLLSTFLWPPVNAQNNPKQVVQITKSLVKSKKTPLQPAQRRPYSKLVPKAPINGVDIMRTHALASAAKLPKTSVPSVVKPLTGKDLRFDVNSNISPLGPIYHYTSPSCSIITDISNEWWVLYIQNLIEEQMFKQMERQLFKQGMRFEEEIDEEAFVIYTYGYKYDAA